MCDSCIERTWLKKTSNSLSFFFKINLFKERMKKFVVLPTKENRQRLNKEMLAPTFFKYYTVHIEELGKFFFHTLLDNLFQQRYIVILQIF